MIEAWPTLPPAIREAILAMLRAAGCEVVQSGRVEDRRLEPGVFACGNRRISGQGGSESGSVGDENAPIDPDLATVTDAWHSLPPDTRTAILAIVEAAQGR